MNPPPTPLPRQSQLYTLRTHAARAAECGAAAAGIRLKEKHHLGLAWKCRRNGLKRLNPRPEMVWARKPGSHNIWYTGARLTVRSGREPQERCRIRRAGPEGNFPPRKALKSLETEKESRKPRRRDGQTGDRAAPPLPRRRAARADPCGAGTGAVASRGAESCRKRRLKS